MADAGLTNGAFYAHFESKDQLVAHTLAEQLREQRESFSTQPQSRAGLEQIVRTYLSVEHRDNPESGCVSAALLDEIRRSRHAVKRAYTDGLLEVIEDLAARLAPQRYGVGTCEDAERLRVDARDAPAVPSAGRPRSGRYGPTAGRPERSCVIGRRASRLIGRSEEFRKLIVYS